MVLPLEYIHTYVPIGNFRLTCEKVMSVLRENRDSLIAMLEAFVYDPLVNWRLLYTDESKKKKENQKGRKNEGLNLCIFIYLFVYLFIYLYTYLYVCTLEYCFLMNFIRFMHTRQSLQAQPRPHRV